MGRKKVDGDKWQLGNLSAAQRVFKILSLSQSSQVIPKDVIIFSWSPSSKRGSKWAWAHLFGHLILCPFEAQYPYTGSQLPIISEAQYPYIEPKNDFASHSDSACSH